MKSRSFVFTLRLRKEVKMQQSGSVYGLGMMLVFLLFCLIIVGKSV